MCVCESGWGGAVEKAKILQVWIYIFIFFRLFQLWGATIENIGYNNKNYNGKTRYSTRVHLNLARKHMSGKQPIADSD